MTEIDLSGIFTSCSGAYSALNIPSSGTVFLNGTYQLTQSNQSIDFDDRFSSNWKRGNKITFTYARPEEPATEYFYPVIGVSYILSTTYDFKSRLDVSVGCVLALLQRRTPSDLGICVEIGNQVDVATAAIELLKAAGVPSDGSDTFVDGINQIDTSSFTNLLSAATIVNPVPVAQGQSIIDAASQLVAPYGCFFYQANNGLVRLTRWSDFSAKGLILSKRARDLHVYRRNGSIDSMIKKLVAKYNVLQVCQEFGTQEQETITGNTRTTVEILRDDVNRQILRTTREYRTVGASEALVSKTTETSVYEPEPAESQALVRVGQALPNSECYPIDRGRLLTKTTETVIDNSLYLQNWLSAKNIAGQVGGSGFPSTFTKALGDPDPEFPIAGVNTTQITTETWTYESETKIIRTIEVQVPQGEIVPLSGDLKLGQTDGRAAATDRDPNVFTISRLTTETYTKSDDACEGWKQTIEVREASYANEPEVVNRQAPDQTTVLEDVLGNAYLLVQTEFITNNNQSEPNPETFPAQINIASQEVELIYGSDNPNYPFDVVETVFLGEYFTYPQEEIEKLGAQMMDINNGRIMGMMMADSPFEVDVDCWDVISPMNFVKVIEPYRDLASVFVVDSPSITISPTETVVGWLGIYLGAQDDDSVINDKTNLTFTRSPNVPPSDKEAITIPSLSLIAENSINIGEE